MRIVILGTGTDVGKTHLGVALVSALTQQGRVACGLKPVESGVVPGAVGPDAAALASAGLFHVKQPPPYALADPVSPHLAARRAGVAIELGRIQRWVDEHAAATLIIETAGGLFSPIAPELTNLDLAQAVGPASWILVAVDRLGVLHDVAACKLAARAKLGGLLPSLTVVLQSPAIADASTGTNADELQALGIARRVLTMPRGIPTSSPCQEAAARILASVEGECSSAP